MNRIEMAVNLEQKRVIRLGTAKAESLRAKFTWPSTHVDKVVGDWIIRNAVENHRLTPTEGALLRGYLNDSATPLAESIVLYAVILQLCAGPVPEYLRVI